MEFLAIYGNEMQVHVGGFVVISPHCI